MALYVVMTIGEDMFRFERSIVDSRTLVIAPAGPDQEELVLQKGNWDNLAQNFTHVTQQVVVSG